MGYEVELPDEENLQSEQVWLERAALIIIRGALKSTMGWRKLLWL
ncbi:MAG: hypothetical protein WCB68_13185 [Pyrinomonadaceae bacterium]